MKLLNKRRLLAVGGMGLLLGGAALVAGSDVCLSAYVLQGVKVPSCPDGRFRQTAHLTARNLGREGTGEVRLWVLAYGMGKGAGALLQAPVRRLEVALVLVDPAARRRRWRPRAAGGRRTPTPAPSPGP